MFINKNNKAQKLDFAVNLLYILLIAGIIYLSYKFLWSLILPPATAFLFAYLLNKLANKVNKILKLKAKTALVLITWLVFILGIAAMSLSTAALILLIKNICLFIPVFTKDTLLPFLDYIFRTAKSLFDNTPSYDITISDAGYYAKELITKILLPFSAKGLSAIGNLNLSEHLFSIITIILLTFFFTLNFEKTTSVLKDYLPKKLVSLSLQAKNIFRNSILKYLQAACILSAITFIEALAGLLIIGKENALLFAIIIAILDFLPILGAGLVFIPYAITEIIALNYKNAVELIVLYVAIIITRNIIEPKIIGEKLGLNPVVAIMSFYLGFKLLGLPGTIIAPPIAIILLELIKTKPPSAKKSTAQKHNVLGDSAPKPPQFFEKN